MYILKFEVNIELLTSYTFLFQDTIFHYSSQLRKWKFFEHTLFFKKQLCVVLPSLTYSTCPASTSIIYTFSMAIRHKCFETLNITLTKHKTKIAIQPNCLFQTTQSTYPRLHTLPSSSSNSTHSFLLPCLSRHVPRERPYLYLCIFRSRRRRAALLLILQAATRLPPASLNRSSLSDSALIPSYIQWMRARETKNPSVAYAVACCTFMTSRWGEGGLIFAGLV